MSAILCKCKSCGGDLELIKGSETIAVCTYCGLKQTIPQADDEKKVQMFDNAAYYLRTGEFDRAAAIYDSITNEFPKEAEAYWGLLLSQYGIQYVESPGSGERKPTCSRADFNSILEDRNFKNACMYSDVLTAKEYEREAEQIEKIRQRIVEISTSAEPYDVFISYKQKDPSTGDRTEDSLLAANLYQALKQKGYRVFFAERTLENKLGSEYEPLIFSALHSARVMLVVATKKKFIEAPWVRNEWSRYLRLIEKSGAGQKYLIPCYRDMSAGELPTEMKNLQAQDMAKLGAVQDVVRGIDKLLGRDRIAQPEQQAQAIPVYQAAGPSAENYLKLAQLELKSEAYDAAESYYDKAIEINAECAEAYLGKLCCRYQVQRANDLANAFIEKATEQYKEHEPAGLLADNVFFQRARQFGDESLQRLLREQERQSLAWQEEELLENVLSYCIESHDEQEDLVEQNSERIEALDAEIESIDKEIEKLEDDHYSWEKSLKRYKEKKYPDYSDAKNIILSVILGIIFLIVMTIIFKDGLGPESSGTAAVCILMIIPSVIAASILGAIVLGVRKLFYAIWSKKDAARRNKRWEVIHSYELQSTSKKDHRKDLANEIKTEESELAKMKAELETLWERYQRMKQESERVEKRIEELGK